MENNKNKVGRPKSNIEYVKTSIRLPKHIDEKIERIKTCKSKAKYLENIVILEVAKTKEDAERSPKALSNQQPPYLPS